MIAQAPMRSRAAVLASCLLALTLQACGGGGGGGGGGASNPTRTPTVSSATPTPGPGGNTATPVLPVTPTPVRPSGSLINAIRNAAPGATILVAPGIYPALTIQASDLQGPITLLADVTGQTETVGAVIIDGGQSLAALQLIGVEGIVVDGFTLQGGTEEALLALDSPLVTIRNCIVRQSNGDGIFVERSNASLVFDNLVINNSGAGLRVFGSEGVELYNNTVYKNTGNGISIGSSIEPATSLVVENNIVNGNTPVGITVHPSTTDYQGDYNLNTDGYGADTLIGLNDLAGPTANPQFVSPTTGDFHLIQPDDACAGGSPAVNRGDPNTPSDLVAALTQRSTSPSGALDCEGFHLCCVGPPPTPGIPGPELGPGFVDLGYHYPPPLGP